MNPPLLRKLSMLISLVIVNIKSMMQFNYTCCSVVEVFTLYINEFHIIIFNCETRCCGGYNGRNYLGLSLILLLVSY